MTVTTHRTPRYRTPRYRRRVALATLLWATAVALMIDATATNNHWVARWSVLTALAGVVAAFNCLGHHIINRLTQNFELWVNDVSLTDDDGVAYYPTLAAVKEKGRHADRTPTDAEDRDCETDERGRRTRWGAR